MKIVCWNCHTGFYTQGKYKKIRELDADVYVICEFNKPSKTDEDYENFIKHHYYLEFPAKRNARGIAVIAKEGITITDNNWYLEESNDFISVRVEDKLDIVAVWTHGEKNEDYLNHVINYLGKYRDKFKNSDNLVMCGDFNLDLGINNLDNKDKFIEILKEYGYESIYHNLNKVNFGEEPQKTFFTNKNEIITEYFDDYLFTNPKIVSSFELGSEDKYIGPDGTDTSDPVPLIFEVDL